MHAVAAFRQLPRAALMLVIARAVSSLGSAATAFALNVWIYKQTGSYAIFAALAIVTALPGLLFAPFAGVIVDRVSRQRLLIACDALAAVAILAVLLASELALLTPWFVGVITVVLALLRTLTWPATSASLSVLAAPGQRARINGIAETLEGATVVASPLIGASLFEITGIAGVASADILSYLVCIAVVARIDFPRIAVAVAVAVAATTGQPRSPLQQLLVDCSFGFRWIAARRDLSRLLLFFALINLGCSVFLVAYAPYVLSFASPATLAVCLGLGGTGTIAGGIAFTASGGLRRPETGVLLGAATLGACMAVFGIARAPAMLYTAAFLYGAAMPLTNASSQTIWQARVPADIQGRVFSIRRMIAWGLNPLSILLSIPLVTTLFGPLLEMGGTRWSPARVWGAGQAGAIGLMMTVFGFACLGVALLLLRVDGLRIQSTAVPSPAPEKPLPVGLENAMQPVQFNVVRNHENQHSIWATDQPIPPGWIAVGKTGSKDECLAYIREVWTDMAPASLAQPI